MKGSASTSPGFVTRASLAVFLETLLMMSVGATFSGILLLATELPLWVRLSAMAMAIGALIPALPPVMRLVLAVISHRRGSSTAGTGSEMVDRNLDSSDIEDSTSSGLGSYDLSWGLLASSWAWSLLSWVCIGTSFTLILQAMPSLCLDSTMLPTTLTAYWVAASASIALGMVLGFASLIPGGAGIREYATLLALTPAFGSAAALASVIAARVLFIAVETLLASISYCVLKRIA